MANYKENFDHNVWDVVASIPSGQVMGYGEVAKAAGFPRYSRMVSSAMGRCPDELPWFRVVRSNRTLAFEYGSESYREQAELLKLEGIQFDGVKIITLSPEEHLDKLLWGPDDN